MEAIYKQSKEGCPAEVGRGERTQSTWEESASKVLTAVAGKLVLAIVRRP